MKASEPMTASKIEQLGIPELGQLLAATEARHSHLCPRQVLGVRIGLAGAAALELQVSRRDKRLLVIVETDGCFTDGVEVATGTSVGHRTLRVVDYGKIAATFINVKTEEAFRVAPKLDIRQTAWEYAPAERRRYFAMLHGYQRMPQEELLSVQPVNLLRPVQEIVSRAGIRTNCSQCGEEIINAREIIEDDAVFCRSCAGFAYYASVAEDWPRANLNKFSPVAELPHGLP